MKHLTMGKKLMSLVLAMVMVASLLSVSASAASNVFEAKASLADVAITQTYNGKTTPDAVHDYNKDGKDVAVTYEATLKMTEEMATYLQARQAKLYEADFEVNVKIDDAASLLDFTKSGDQKVTFTSTFLKPMDSDNYTYKLLSRNGKVFEYELTFKESALKGKSELSFPMELITYYDGKTAYGYEESKAIEGAQFMYVSDNYSVADWMSEIKITLADMKVKDSVEPTVTSNSSTWKTIVASGTVTGEFAYATAAVPATIAEAATYADNSGWHRELKFGNDADITEWKSNEVKLLLKRSANYGPVNPPEPSDLNVKDHFAYVIGYPDGMVKPAGNVTRAEVATIFFRMLKDEARDRYWSKTNSYTDVKSTDWYNNAISTLSNMNIINGYPDGSFRPNAGITRAEFAKIAVSFFRDYSRQTLGDLFSDISGQWYTEYINLAAELDIVNGYPDGTFRPNNLITRAEAMTIVNNTLRRTPHKEGLLPEKDMITWPDNPKNMWYYEAVQEATNSHEYYRASVTDNEQWTKELPVRDWAAFERAWSDSHAATNPGDVVDGQNGYLQP